MLKKSVLVVLWLGAMTAAAEDHVRMVTVEGEGANYWPGWRGPSAQGYVKGSGYPDTWSSTENVLWRASVPGEGNSSPIVWRDRIFLTTSRTGGRKLSLLSFRRSDGKSLWETAIPQNGVERGHDKNGHASATPITDGRLVYASFGTHGLYAFDFDGTIVWHAQVPKLDNYHGSAGSPVLYQNTVILYQDHQGQSFVAAFHKQTGNRIWRTERDARTGWGTPVVIRAGRRDELIVSSQHKVTAYDPASGTELWHVTGNKFEVIPTPVVGHDLVFASSGRAGPTIAIRAGGRGDVTDTRVVWRSPKGAPFVPSAIIVGEQLYTINDMQAVITSFEATTGKVLFQGRLGTAPREGFSASPVTVDGKIFFTNDEGETFVLKAGPEFELLHVNRLGARTLASPALVDGRWYFRTQNELICIGSS
ncbi:MAG: PQQ-binding-like beta-propeller repeat protein [Acidobacteriota bacterium]|nr:MAG: PQQ-binding-like beta-propeller repeat protein [Acidobacteriota bacterium]